MSLFVLIVAIAAINLGVGYGLAVYLGMAPPSVTDAWMALGELGSPEPQFRSYDVPDTFLHDPVEPPIEDPLPDAPATPEADFEPIADDLVEPADTESLSPGVATPGLGLAPDSTQSAETPHDQSASSTIPQ